MFLKIRFSRGGKNYSPETKVVFTTTSPPRIFVCLTSTVETCVIPESSAALRIEPFPKFINPHKTEVPLAEPLFAPIVPSAHTGVNVVQEANNNASAANEPKSTFFRF